MRFISRYGRLTLPPISAIEKAGPQGQVDNTEERGILCQFEPNRLREHEWQQAQREFGKLNGTMSEMDERTDVPARHRIGIYDTDEAALVSNPPWSAERKERVESWLLSQSMDTEARARGLGGIFTPEGKLYSATDRLDVGERFLIVAEELVDEPPWPKYDELRGRGQYNTAEAIRQKVKEDGYDVNEVIAYEKRNARREDVIKALETLLILPDEALIEVQA